MALLWPRLRSGDARATAVLAAFVALVTSAGLPGRRARSSLRRWPPSSSALRHPAAHEAALEGADGTLPGSDPTP